MEAYRFSVTAVSLLIEGFLSVPACLVNTLLLMNDFILIIQSFMSLRVSADR